MTTTDVTAVPTTRPSAADPASAVRPTVAREYTRWLLEREADLAAKVAAVTRLARSWSEAHPPAADGQDGVASVAELAAELLQVLQAPTPRPTGRAEETGRERVSQHFQLTPTSADELDAQEPTSTVRGADGEVWKKGEDDLWRSTSSGALTSGTLARTGPLTLLFSPTWVPVSDLDQVLLEAGLANLWTTRPERRTDVETFLDTHPTWLLDVSLAPQMPPTRSA